MFAMKGQVKTSQFIPYICFNFSYTLRATFIDHKKMVNSAHYNQSKSDFKKGMPRKPIEHVKSNISLNPQNNGTKPESNPAMHVGGIQAL